MKTKNVLTIIACTLFIMPLMAQERYKDVYENAQNMSPQNAYQAYFRFLNKNNKHANACYQMARISQDLTGNYNQFLMSKIINDYLKSAELYYSLSKHFIQESGVGGQAKYFKVQTKKPGRTPSEEEILADIDNRMKSLIEYKELFYKNLHMFESAANHYNNCIDLYNNINKKNSRLKDMYFLYDDSLSTQLNSLQLSFDSTIFYLNGLQKSAKENPVDNYTFNYKLVPIEIYRLHGLTSANLLAPLIQLWDFGTWIKDFKNVLDTEVDFLYKNVEDINKLHNKYIKSLLAMNTDEIPNNYKIPPLIHNKILKYDFQSLMGKMLEYQNKQINFLYNIASFKTDTSILSVGITKPKPYQFYNTLLFNNEAETLLNTFGQLINDEAVKKYNNFFNNNYGGISGLKKYVVQQKIANKKSLHSSFDEFNNQIIKSKYHDTSINRTIDYKKVPIYMESISPEQIWGKGYFVHCSAQRTDKRTLFGGTYVNHSGQKLGFVAVIDTSRKVQWLKTFKQGNADRNIVMVNQINDELVAVMSTVNRSAGSVKSYIFLLDWNGNTKLSKEIKAPAVPRQMIVDDISNSFIITLKGKQQNQYAIEDDNLYVLRIDGQLNTTWQSKLKFNGYVTNIIRADQNYYVYGTYNNMLTANEITLNLDNKFNAFVYSLNSLGQWGTYKTFERKFSYFPLRVNKVDSRTVELNCAVGIEPFTSIQDKSKPGAPFYLVSSFNGDEIMSCEPNK